jgi:hypothetical protein
MSSFDVKRAVLMTASGAVFAWLGSGAVPRDRARSASLAVRAPPKREAAPPATIEPLHDWRRLAGPPAHARNLFVFRSPASSPAAVEKPIENAATTAVVPAVPPAPAMKLEGVAEDFGAAGTTRTAIISAAGQLFLVTDGEAVMSRYRVAAVSSTSVDLTDLLTGASLKLILK